MSLNEITNPNVLLNCVFNTAFEAYTPVSITTTSTLSVAGLLGGVLVTNGGGGITITTPTAANIFAALPLGAQKVGVGFVLVVSNIAAQTVTLAGGTNVGITNLAVNPIAANTARTLVFVCTAIGPTPAFSVYG